MSDLATLAEATRAEAAREEAFCLPQDKINITRPQLLKDDARRKIVSPNVSPDSLANMR